MTDRRERDSSSRWWLVLLGLPVLCCAGTALLGAIGIGSVTAAVGGISGSALLSVVGAVLVSVAGVVLVRRRVRR